MGRRHKTRPPDVGQNLFFWQNRGFLANFASFCDPFSSRSIDAVIVDIIGNLYNYRNIPISLRSSPANLQVAQIKTALIFPPTPACISFTNEPDSKHLAAKVPYPDGALPEGPLAVVLWRHDMALRS